MGTGAKILRRKMWKWTAVDSAQVTQNEKYCWWDSDKKEVTRKPWRAPRGEQGGQESDERGIELMILGELEAFQKAWQYHNFRK